MLLLVCHRENGYKVNWKVEDNTIFQLNDGKMVPNGAFTFGEFHIPLLTLFPLRGSSLMGKIIWL